MLTVLLSATDDFDAVELRFEHSLVSLSKWESLYKKPFLGNKEISKEEFASYIKCMLLSENVSDEVLNRLGPKEITRISEYINDPHTATTFRDEPGSKKSAEIVTSELVYYWLVQFKINWEAQHWHLNRLMTLVKITGIKQTKPKPMSKAEQAEQMRKLNAERRAASGSSG